MVTSCKERESLGLFCPKAVETRGKSMGVPAYCVIVSFGSAGKESACNAEDPSLIRGLERSPGEGVGDPLQYSWASLMAQPLM